MSQNPGGVAAAERRSLRHDALIYDGHDEFVASLAPLAREAQRRGEAVAVFGSPHKKALLREAVGDAPIHGIGEDTGEMTHAQRIAVLHREGTALASSGVPRVCVFGDVACGASTDEQLDWMRYEAVLNRVFRSVPRWFVCGYDRRRVPAWLLDAAERAHPCLWLRGRRRPSERYEDPATLVREWTPALPRPQREPDLDILVNLPDLARARGALEQAARLACGSRQRATEVTIGLHEVLGNALEHGSEPARVRCWYEPGALRCEVIDDGPGFDDPFAGYWPPNGEQVDGRGLWLTRQTIDRVELEPAQHDGGLRVVLSTTL